MKKGKQNLVLTDFEQDDVDDNLFWDEYDQYPNHRLREIEQSSVRSDLILFIQTLNSRIEYDRPVPRHWIAFTARLLMRAAKIADDDPNARNNPLAAEMGLSGRKSHFSRNCHIAIEVHRLVAKDDKRGRVKRAVLTVMQELKDRGENLSIRTIRRIYEEKDKERLEEEVRLMEKDNKASYQWLK